MLLNKHIWNTVVNLRYLLTDLQSFFLIQNNIFFKQWQLEKKTWKNICGVFNKFFLKFLFQSTSA